MPVSERAALGRVRRLSRWFYRKQHGDLRDRAEQLATDPLMIDTIGTAEEARRVVYESYGNIIEDVVLGQSPPKRELKP